MLSLYRQSDLFVLPSRVAADGDRDGLPNVLMEAASQRLAIVATSLPGIGELITSDTHGLLVPPDDSTALSGAIFQAVTDPRRRTGWGNAARERVVHEFDHTDNVQPLIALLNQGSGAS